MKEFNIFIENKVWESKLKYHRMMLTTKEKFFKDLKDKKSVEQYSKALKELWNIDHDYMNKAIKELEEMVSQKNIEDYQIYEEKPITEQVSEKLTNGKLYYKTQDKQIYPLNKESDFRKIEQQYVDKHIRYYERQKEVIDNMPDEEQYLTNLVDKYDKIDKTIPYYNKDGTIKCYNTIATYNSMLYNWNLTHAGWNRTMYDAKILNKHLYYLPAHTFACPHCAYFQGKVYTDDPLDSKYPLKENAIAGGVGHPNCGHQWTIFWNEEQIQEDKYNSSEWEEAYKAKQKIQSLDLEKSKLLADRRIYKELGNQDKVDQVSSKIKKIREKKKELELTLPI